MINVIKYSADKKQEWDNFVASAKNGTFLFYRDYMEYHADRFEDHSLLIYNKNKLVALLPANVVGDTVYSHQGLTFGGIIHSIKNTSLEFLSIFDEINKDLKSNGINEVIYKAIPQIYKSTLGDEEYYAIFKANATLIACNLSSCIDLKHQIPVSRNRQRNHKKAVANGLNVQRSKDFATFWAIMEDNMRERFDKKPVHTVDEMIQLSQSFPNNIDLWLSKQDDTVLAGAVLYKFKNVIKVQYAHASPEGKQTGAIDSIYFKIIDEYKASHLYIDFGTSNTDNGKATNEGLLNQKESFGARGIVCNSYKYSVL